MNGQAPCEVTVPHKLCRHNRKGRLDGPCYVLPTPRGNALRHLPAPADRPPDPGHHRTRPPSSCSAGPTRAPASHRFETRLQESLRESGRIIIEWTFNHLEPHDRRELPGQIESGGTWYRRRSKAPNRSVAAPFGTIILWRRDQDVHGVEPSIFPLEIRLGLELLGRTLAERVALARWRPPSPRCSRRLRDDHGVRGRRRPAGGDRRRGGGDGGPPSGGPGRPPALLAGSGGPVLGLPQAGAGGVRRADATDPRPCVLPRRGHGDVVLADALFDSDFLACELRDARH